MRAKNQQTAIFIQERQLKFLVYSIFVTILSFAGNAYATWRNLPTDILSQAVSEDIVYDADFDYQKLGKIYNLDIFPDEIFSHKKNLVDHVIVHKSHHQMLLMNKNHVVKKYWIALSDRPVGRKQYEGDRRTPEGTYTLDYIKEHSNYYRAFHISYPNEEDIQNARKMGMRPGGMIMIHGQPPSSGEYQGTVQRTDWTNGCIALLNPDIDEFISLVDVGTKITIYP